MCVRTAGSKISITFPLGSYERSRTTLLPFVRGLVTTFLTLSHRYSFFTLPLVYGKSYSNSAAAAITEPSHTSRRRTALSRRADVGSLHNAGLCSRQYAFTSLPVAEACPTLTE